MLTTSLTQLLGIETPIIGGAMYPCSNPELVGAVSRAGGIGIVQPISLTYVHGHDFRAGLRLIKELAGGKPIGLNLLIEKSSKTYLERNRQWAEIALEEGVRFFITALGDPRWVVDLAKPKGGIVFHDVTERKWADKALLGGVDGLICVNNRAGGHAGTLSPQALYDSLKDLGKPLICAGGIGGPERFVEALKIGYQGVQLGTRFIASQECKAHPDYKNAILKAEAEDIILTKKITGVPVAVINTAFIKKLGTDAGWFAKMMLRGQKTKHLARMFYTLRSAWQLKRSLKHGSAYKDFFQAGKSVDDIEAIEPVATIVERFKAAAQAAT
jgi:nitronate monooxygenase